MTSTGARMPRANMNTILDFEFRLPPLSEQEKIVFKIDTVFSKIDLIDNILSTKSYEYAALKSAVLAQELQKELT